MAKVQRSKIVDAIKGAGVFHNMRVDLARFPIQCVATCVAYGRFSYQIVTDLSFMDRVLYWIAGLTSG